MFTGIIDHCGTIQKIESTPQSQKFWIKTQFNNLSLGESIAVNGVCLTVTHCLESIFCCDLSPETLKLTTLKFLQVNEKVNLERALTLSSRLGGHFVSGHVDEMGSVITRLEKNEFLELTIGEIPAEFHHFLIKKGSIAVNGVSLTINELTKDGFSVMLIPHTLECTQLNLLKPTDRVNLEFDMIAKLIAEQSQRYMSEKI